MLVRCGRTPMGSTNWQSNFANTIFVDVDTTSAGFDPGTVPHYVTSLGGNLKHFEALGGNAIYEPSPTKFRIYVRFPNGSSLTPADANSWNWHVVWIGEQP